MASSTTDRQKGLVAGVAMKAPARAGSTANLTLSGEQTIDGVAVVALDRVLVKDQTTDTENGIYVADTGSWSRDVDADGNRDLVGGSLVLVTEGTVNAGTSWKVTGSGDVTIDTDSINFTDFGQFATSTRIYHYATVAAMVASTELNVGDTVDTSGYYAAGDGGDNRYSVVAAATGTVDGGQYIDLATHQAKGLFPRRIVQALQFGAKGDGVTDDTTAIQALAAFTRDVYLPDTGSAYIMTDRILITTDDYTIRGDPGRSHIKWTSLGAARDAGTTATRWTQGGSQTDGIRVEASKFLIKDLILQGGEVAAYDAKNHLLLCTGVSSASRKSNFVVDNVECYDSGDTGLWFAFCNRITVRNCHLHDIGFYGGIFFSCTEVDFHHNRINDITPGTGGVMYGVSFTHDSTLYNTDANVNTLQADAPFCSEIDVYHNRLYDLPNWAGIDFHGGWNSSIHHNKTFNCFAPISLTTSSGDALNYAGSNSRISDNLCDARNADGTASGIEGTSTGLTLRGGSTAQHRNVVCAGNIMLGYGIINNVNTGSFLVSQTSGAQIVNNVVDKWMGQVFYSNEATGLNLSGNVVKGKNAATADSADVVIRNPGTTATNKQQYLGNLLDAGADTAPSEGVRMGFITMRPKFSDNDFSDATNEYILSANNRSTGSNLTTLLSAGVSDTTPPLTIPGINYGDPILLLFNPTGGNVIVTDLDDAVLYQRVTLMNVHAANTITFDRSNAALAGGANWVGNRYDTLDLIFDGTLWIEMGRSANS